MEKLMANATACMPGIERLAGERARELSDLKSKVRTNPEEVEAWFDKEIAKVGNLDVGSLFGKAREIGLQ